MNKKVFVELMRRGYIPGQTLFYYHTRNDKEIDFVTRKGAVVPGRGGGIMVGISVFGIFFVPLQRRKEKRL